MSTMCTVCAQAPATHSVLAYDLTRPHWKATTANHPTIPPTHLGHEFCAACAADVARSRNAKAPPPRRTP